MSEDSSFVVSDLSGTLGERIIALLAIRKQSQEWLAERIGVHPSTVFRWTSGGRIRPLMLKKLALALGVVISTLVPEDVPEECAPEKCDPAPAPDLDRQSMACEAHSLIMATHGLLCNQMRLYGRMGGTSSRGYGGKTWAALPMVQALGSVLASLKPIT